MIAIYSQVESAVNEFMKKHGPHVLLDLLKSYDDPSKNRNSLIPIVIQAVCNEFNITKAEIRIPNKHHTTDPKRAAVFIIKTFTAAQTSAIVRELNVNRQRLSGYLREALEILESPDHPANKGFCSKILSLKTKLGYQ